MPTSIGIGFSQEIDPEKAAKNAAFEAKTELEEDHIDFALVLSSIHYRPQQTVPIINRVLNNAKMIGCSTAGIILSDSIETRGIAVLTVTSQEMKFGVGSVENIGNQDARVAGTVLARNSLSDFGKHGRHAFVYFIDGNLKKNTQVLSGIQEVMGNLFPIVGAGSCDDFHFFDSFQLCQNQALKSSAAGLILGGHISVGVGGKHGWRPLGKPRTINAVEGNTIKTIDNQKASHLYEEFFGDEAGDLFTTQFGQMAILYPLGINVEEGKQYLLRNAVDILKDGSIVCQSEPPQGSDVHIMIGNKDSCKQAAVEAAQEALKGLRGKQAQLVIVLESMARLKLLGRTAFQEIQKIKEIFGTETPIIGMYANGEICPFQSDENNIQKPYLQNESIVILAIG